MIRTAITTDKALYLPPEIRLHTLILSKKCSTCYKCRRVIGYGNFDYFVGRLQDIHNLRTFLRIPCRNLTIIMPQGGMERFSLMLHNDGWLLNVSHNVVNLLIMCPTWNDTNKFARPDKSSVPNTLKKIELCLFEDFQVMRTLKY